MVNFQVHKRHLLTFTMMAGRMRVDTEKGKEFFLLQGHVQSVIDSEKLSLTALTEVDCICHEIRVDPFDSPQFGANDITEVELDVEDAPDKRIEQITKKVSQNSVLNQLGTLYDSNSTV